MVADLVLIVRYELVILMVSFFEIGVLIAVVLLLVLFVEYPSLSPQFVRNTVLEFLSSSFRYLVE